MRGHGAKVSVMPAFCCVITLDLFIPAQIERERGGDRERGERERRKEGEREGEKWREGES